LHSRLDIIRIHERIAFFISRGFVGQIEADLAFILGRIGQESIKISGIILAQLPRGSFRRVVRDSLIHGALFFSAHYAI
jgi:hypothetical protein